MTYMFNLDFEQSTLESAADQIIDAAKDGHKGLVVTPNVDHVVMLQDDNEMQQIYKEALFRYADGMPLVWVSRLATKKPLPERVTGADLLPALCRKAALEGLSVYFLGGNPGIASQAAEAMCAKYRGLNVAGIGCPPLGFEKDPIETDRIIDDINSRQVNILFIGVGAPKQEKWAYANLKRLKVGPILCVGAAFDFAAGARKRAPVVVQKAGLEWLWRLCSEPGRMWRRYLLRDSRFVLIAMKELIKSL